MTLVLVLLTSLCEIPLTLSFCSIARSKLQASSVFGYGKVNNGV